MGLSKETQQMLFQIGYTAKGIVYALIGFFALGSLIGISRGATGPKEIIEWLGNSSLGHFALVAIGLGLLCYCGYRLYMAIMDTKNEGEDATALVKRIGWAVSGTSYGILSVFAFKEAFAGGGSKGGKQTMIATILEQNWGHLAVGLIGLIVLGVAAYQVYRAVKDKHMKDVKSQGLSQTQENTFRIMGRVGLVARAVVFTIIAYFLYRAAQSEDASEFRGIEESLEYLNQGWGNVALAIIGLGLLAYGLFMFVRARFERV
ncbi:DUF1206 domain-containing protein [Neolewinella antarctica]|uniref:DUF1206 domain-containing protein n=1 Tax=Neolewinella antarctica TaxID=442734 RepID=A0ABX0XD51_9BACT|nr:DUF1206 domain-containing protein [Neolewinella antarctica]NJC26856.1 hypothetical protein [Neolewinella antarctica]